MTTTLRKASHVYARLAEGASLHTIAREFRKERDPTLSQMRKWLRDSQEFRDRYLIAREVHADRLREDMQRIADGLTRTTDPARIDAARIRIEVYRDAIAAVERDCARVRQGRKRPREKAEIIIPPLPLIRIRYV